MYRDTIVAVATPPGQGAIGVVRLSGDNAKAVTQRLFDRELRDRRASHGHIRDPGSGETIDEALVTFMAGPHSYTGEDCVELSCHGSPLVLQRLLALALQHGSRLANPGEFTLRAFLNGRIDLAQAEAVLDIIQAQSDAALRLAVQGLGGRLSTPIKDIYQRVMQVQAYLTACIDFPEDEVESQIDKQPMPALLEAEKELVLLLESADIGMVYRHGVRTAIIGRPNVGKSSLLNRLLGEDRAIVTDVPGTTRDTVEELLTVRGIPFHLIDTAGIQETRDAVEHIGVERSRRAGEQADMLVIVVDTGAPLTREDGEIMTLGEGKPSVIVANKCDLPERACLAEIRAPLTRVSALTGAGMEGLYDALESVALGGRVSRSDSVLVTNPRHEAALGRSLHHLRAALQGLADGMPEDFITIDLSACLSALSEITGENADEVLLDTIFSTFCIGK